MRSCRRVRSPRSTSSRAQDRVVGPGPAKDKMNAVLEQTLVSVTLPEMGESVTEGSIVEWRKGVGEFVAEGDPLVEVTTDKVDVEVPATASGVVTRILAREGETVAVGSLLAEIDASKTDGAAVRRRRHRTGYRAAAPDRRQLAPPASSGERVADAPARRIAQRLGVDLTLVRGSGPNGLILRSDVEAQAQSAAPSSDGRAVTPADSSQARSSRRSRARRPRSSATWSRASRFRRRRVFAACAVDVLDARRKELNGGVQAAGRNERISFTHIIAYALVRAAHELPFITYSFRRDESGAPARLEPGSSPRSCGRHRSAKTARVLGRSGDPRRRRARLCSVSRALRRARRKGAREHARCRRSARRLVYADQSRRHRHGCIGAALDGGSRRDHRDRRDRLSAGICSANEQSLRLLGVSRVMQLTSTYDHRVIQGAQSGEYLRRVDELLQGSRRILRSDLRVARLASRAVTGSCARVASAAPAAKPSDEMLRAVAAGMAIVSAYRRHGHLAANLDPLGARAGRRRIARAADLRPYAGVAERDSGRRAARQSAGQHAR